MPFDLLSDWDRDISKKYDSFNEKEGVANRNSFLIDKNGVIRFIQKSSLNEPRDFNDMMKQVEVLQSD